MVNVLPVRSSLDAWPARVRGHVHRFRSDMQNGFLFNVLTYGDEKTLWGICSDAQVVVSLHSEFILVGIHPRIEIWKLPERDGACLCDEWKVGELYAAGGSLTLELVSYLDEARGINFFYVREVWCCGLCNDHLLGNFSP